MRRLLVALRQRFGRCRRCKMRHTKTLRGAPRTCARASSMVRGVRVATGRWPPRRLLCASMVHYRARVLARRVLGPYCGHRSCYLVLLRPVPPAELLASPPRLNRTAAQSPKSTRHCDCRNSTQLLARLGLPQSVKFAIAGQRASCCAASTPWHRKLGAASKGLQGARRAQAAAAIRADRCEQPPQHT